MSSRELDAGIATVEELLAHDQPGFFAAIGELPWYSSSHQRWIEDLKIPAGGRVLEVGCATGALTAHMAGSGYRVIGLDRSHAMIRRARKDHPRLDFDVGDATMLPYDDDTFDAVIAASVVNVVSDAKLVLSEMRRVCAANGAISVLAPSIGFTDENLDVLIETLGLTGFSRAALARWHRSATKMSRPQLESLLHFVGTEAIVTRMYLDGMLIAVSGTCRSL